MVNRATGGEEGRGCYMGESRRQSFWEHKSGQTQISSDVKSVSLSVNPTLTLPEPSLPVLEHRSTGLLWRTIPTSLGHQSSS